MNNWMEKASNFEDLNDRVVSEGESRFENIKLKNKKLASELDTITSENTILSSKYEELTSKYE